MLYHFYSQAIWQNLLAFWVPSTSKQKLVREQWTKEPLFSLYHFFLPLPENVALRNREGWNWTRLVVLLGSIPGHFGPYNWTPKTAKHRIYGVTDCLFCTYFAWVMLFIGFQERGPFLCWLKLTWQNKMMQIQVGYDCFPLLDFILRNLCIVSFI